MVANEKVNSRIFFFRLFFLFCPKRKGVLSHMLARKRTRSWDMQCNPPTTGLDGLDDHVPRLFFFKNNI